jgi:hypothetical protein
MLHVSCDIFAVLHPSKDVALCFEDEMRTGLHPTLRRMWAKKGSKPSYPSDIRYEWLYAFAFVFPEDGENHWWLLPTVTIAVMNIALREFALQANPDGKRLIVRVVDQAGFHLWQRLQIPEGGDRASFPSAALPGIAARGIRLAAGERGDKQSVLRHD